MPLSYLETGSEQDPLPAVPLAVIMKRLGGVTDNEKRHLTMTGIDIPEIIHRTRQEYLDSYESMNWLTPKKAETVSRLREDLIHAIFDNHATGPGWLFSRTKLFTHAISPG